MDNLEKLENELKSFIIQTLALEDIAPEDITSEMQLFGGGLGLDSVDALELGVALQKHYGIKVEAGENDTRERFACVRNLAAYVAEARAQR